MRSRIAIMLLLVTVCVLPCAFAAELRASKAAVRKDVIAVVSGQLEAFRAGDAQKAYGFAAGPLRAQTSFRSFVAILQANYPEIWTNTGAEYGIVRDDGTRATLVVHVTSPGGEAAFNYVLLKERAGWRIGSVVRHVGRKRDDV